jgi:hypothetical protein
MYILSDDNLTGIRVDKSGSLCSNVTNRVETKIVHLLVNWYKLVATNARDE